MQTDIELISKGRVCKRFKIFVDSQPFHGR